MADRVLVYDDARYVDVVLDTLKKIDKPNESETEGPIVREYAPRYIGLEAAASALASFDNRAGGNQMLHEPRNITRFHDRNVLVLRDSEKRVAEMAALLASLDHPEPQVILTCYFVRGGATGDETGLPKDLVGNLEKLVPGLRFSSVGFGLLRTSVVSERRIELRVEAAGGAFELSLQPVAFDPETANLTVQHCRLARDVPGAPTNADASVSSQPLPDAQSQQGRRQVFSTNALLRGGEYTVLGASGAEPLFLVLHLAPIR
jgi:hypothetical protein